MNVVNSENFDVHGYVQFLFKQWLMLGKCLDTFNYISQSMRQWKTLLRSNGRGMSDMIHGEASVCM